MSNISTTIDNLVIRRIVGTAIKNAIGHADPVGEQGVEGAPLGPDPFKHKLSLGDKDYITFHLSGTLKIEVE